MDSIHLAHEGAARNNENNISNVLVTLSAIGSGDLGKSLVAGICGIGNIHAPITQARRVLFFLPMDYIEREIERGAMIPGFGNSFHKDSIDPAFIDFDTILRSGYPDIATKLQNLSDLMKKHQRPHHPNAAAYTAIAAELLGMASGLESLLLIKPRLEVWAERFATARKESKQLMGVA